MEKVDSQSGPPWAWATGLSRKAGRCLSEIGEAARPRTRDQVSNYVLQRRGHQECLPLRLPTAVAIGVSKTNHASRSHE